MINYTTFVYHKCYFKLLNLYRGSGLQHQKKQIASTQIKKTALLSRKKYQNEIKHRNT